MIPQEEALLDSLPHPQRADLVAVADLNPESPMAALARAELGEKEDHDGQLLHHALNKAVNPRAHAYLLSKTLLRQWAISGADQALNQGLDRLEKTCAHLDNHRFSLLPLRIKLHQAQAQNNLQAADRILQKAQEHLTQEAADSDPRLEWQAHHVVLLAQQGAWLQLDQLLTQLNPHRQALLNRIGFDLEIQELQCLIKTWRLAEAFERSRNYEGRPHRAVFHARALIWLGDHSTAQGILQTYQHSVSAMEQLLARWDFACARGDAEALLAVCEDYLSISDERHRAIYLAESALIRNRIQQARLAIRNCGNEANPIRMRIALKAGNVDEALPYAQTIIEQAGKGGLLYTLHEAWENTGPMLLDLWLAATGDIKPSRSPYPTIARQPPASSLQSLVGSSPAMQTLRQQIERVAQRQEPVLIIGETGTGKELVAHAVHDAGRAQKPFIAVNCSGLPESLAEATLFGHRKGSFTGANDHQQGLIELAQNGTLFLDEIDSMPLSMQGLLLRVLESGDYWPIGASKPRKIRARIVAACQQPLDKAVGEGRCREDLRYRLERLTIHIPLLRDRYADLPDLYRHFCQAMGENDQPLSEQVLARWQNQPWPGNVREFRNAVERYVILGDTDLVPRTPGTIHVGPLVQQAQSASKGNPNPEHLGPPQAAHRRIAILDLLGQTPEISRKSVCEHLHCAPKTASEDLRYLEERGLLRRISEGPPRLHYYVKNE